MDNKTIRDLLESTKSTLLDAGIHSAVSEAETICSEVLKIQRLELHLNQEVEISDTDRGKIDSMVAQRCTHIPLQYILGKSYFRDICLKVGPGVLIPRPETELLVDLACKHLHKDALVCDLGTGSGAIALAIAYENPGTRVYGLDISQNALRYAIDNQQRLNIDNAEFQQSDIFSFLYTEEPSLRFDLITANLPYVTSQEYSELPLEIQNFEPKNALLADDDGLKYIRKVIPDAKRFLKPGGTIILEIGSGQADSVMELFNQQGSYTDVNVCKDLNQLDRFVVAVRQ